MTAAETSSPTSSTKPDIKRVKLIAAVLVGIIIIAGFGLYNVMHSPFSCDDAIAKQASGAYKTYIRQGNINPYKKIVDSIISHNVSTKDPTCMYIVAEYDLSIGNADKSEQAIKNLKSLPNFRKGINHFLFDGNATLDTLQRQLEVLKSAPSVNSHIDRVEE
ncbi:MAG TPA: hypothetical protein VHB51_00225 [Candidatus Saccharimonadales bacterium]|nr:hypothetical protein [Candidatus Saccharimonadales bacterium]